MSKHDHQEALNKAVQLNPNIDWLVPLSMDLNDWAHSEDEVVDIDTWFQKVKIIR